MLLAKTLVDRASSPILLLGAGVSIESGGKCTQDIIDEVVQESFGSLPDTVIERRLLFNQYLNDYNTCPDRRAIFDRRFSGLNPSHGYRKLAHLVKDGRLTTILTTNFDPLMEQALTQVGLVPNKDYLLHIRQTGKDHGIRLSALESSNLVHLVKLHGDSRHGVFFWTGDETRGFPDELRDALVAQLNGRDVIIIGYSGHDEDVMAVMRQATPRRIWWVNPQTPGNGSGDAMARKLLEQQHCGQYCIFNEQGNEGEFDNFMDALYRAVAKKQRPRLEELAPDFMVLDKYHDGLRGTARPERFYKGEHPWFHHIASDLDIRRQVGAELLSFAERKLLPGEPEKEIRKVIPIVAISGRPGSGKRTSMLRLGWTLYHEYGCVVAKLHWRTRARSSPLVDQIKALQTREGQPVCVLIEQLPKRYRELAVLFKGWDSTYFAKPVLIVGTGTEPEWEFFRKHKKSWRLKSDHSIEERTISLEPLHSNELSRLRTYLGTLRDRESKLAIPPDLELAQILDRCKSKLLVEILREVFDGGVRTSDVIRSKWEDLSGNNCSAAALLKAVAVLFQYSVFLPFSLARKIAGLGQSDFSESVLNACGDLVVRNPTDWAEVVLKMRHEWLAQAAIQVVAPSQAEQLETLKAVLKRIDTALSYERKTAIYLCKAVAFEKIVSSQGEKSKLQQHGQQLVTWLLAERVDLFCASRSLEDPNSKKSEIDDWLLVFREFKQWQAAFDCYKLLSELDANNVEWLFQENRDRIMQDMIDMDRLDIAIRRLANAAIEGSEDAKLRIDHLIKMLADRHRSEVLQALNCTIREVWPSYPGRLSA